jgi:hypothetical protein
MMRVASSARYRWQVALSAPIKFLVVTGA